MPRIAKKGHVIEYKKEDGSILRARIEQRPEGTYALDLRAFLRISPKMYSRFTPSRTAISLQVGQ